MPACSQDFEGLFVVTVQGFQCRQQFGGQAQRIERFAALPRPFFGIFLPM